MTLLISEDLDKLDKLAAEKIMGWRWSSPLKMWLNLDSTYAIAPETNRGPWQPTRNIAQAWELLEKLGYQFDVSSVPANSFYCSIYLDGEDAESMEETAPLAITKACLKGYRYFN